MITSYTTYGRKDCIWDMVGKSTDEKPLDVANASTFYEMDTKTLYMFDAEDRVWLPQ